MEKTKKFQITLQDAAISLPDDWKCTECQTKYKDIYEMCDDCAKKPVPQDLILKFKAYITQKIKLIELVESKGK